MNNRDNHNVNNDKKKENKNSTMYIPKNILITGGAGFM